MREKLRRLLMYSIGQNPDAKPPEPKVVVEERIIMVPIGAERTPIFCMCKRTGGYEKDQYYTLDLHVALDWKRAASYQRMITVIEGYVDPSGDVYLPYEARKISVIDKVPQ